MHVSSRLEFIRGSCIEDVEMFSVIFRILSVVEISFK